jgi:hypothetical protein
MSSSTRRQQDEYTAQRQSESAAATQSIDETKEEMRRAIQEMRRETPRYSQTFTDFQNETADATQEIADNFLESQKEVINSMQSAWGPIAERMGRNQPIGMMRTPFFYFLSPIQMADIYARTIGAMTEAYAAYTRMATNMLFSGMDATRVTANYARQTAKEAARITSNTARTFARTARETVEVEGERGRGGAGTTTTTTIEDIMSSSSGTMAGAETNTASSGTTTSGFTDRTKKR